MVQIMFKVVFLRELSFKNWNNIIYIQSVGKDSKKQKLRKMSDSEDGVQCRSCLSTTATEYIHMESSMVGEYSYIECFNICTNLNAILDEGFPDYICDKCSQDLQVSFDFVNEARMADAALRKNLPIQKQQIAPIALDEKEYVWTEEDEVNLQKEDAFEDTQMEFMDDDDVEEYQDVSMAEVIFHLLLII